jgi:hypothetical protein
MSGKTTSGKSTKAKSTNKTNNQKPKSGGSSESRQKRLQQILFGGFSVMIIIIWIVTSIAR